MSKQSNQRYRKEVMKTKQDSIKSTVSKSDVKNNVSNSEKESFGHTQDKQ